MRTIACISDLHIGSRYAIFPEEFKTKEGNILRPSEGQMKILEYFVRFNEICYEKGVDTVLLLGDLVHGQNVIEMGTGLVTVDMDEQVELCCSVLDIICKGRKVAGVSGSRYHRSLRGHNVERDIIKHLGGKYLGRVANLRFAPSKRVFNISHGESAAYIYREMLLGREITFTKASEALGKVKKIDAFLRGHWHQFIHLHEKKVHFIQVPGWMAFEPSKPYLVSYGKMQPDIGGVIIFIDDRDRIDPKHYLMEDIPHIADEIEDF